METLLENIEASEEFHLFKDFTVEKMLKMESVEESPSHIYLRKKIAIRDKLINNNKKRRIQINL